jgi:hypothetical protein
VAAFAPLWGLLEQVPDPRRAEGKLADSEWNSHVAAILRVERDVLTRSAKTGRWQRSTHTAYYLSNMPINAARAGEAIRAH